MLPRESQLRSSLREHSLAISDLFVSILITSLGYFECRIGSVVFRLCDDSLLNQFGGTIANIVNWGVGAPLSNPAEVGGFAGSVIQFLGLIIALVAGIIAIRQNYRTGIPAKS